MNNTATSPVSSPEAGQREIDISNLRFYAQMAKLHKWETDIIHWGVVHQTLIEIADRIAQQAPAGQTAQQVEAWLISFDDAEMPPEVFTGPGSEDAARTRFASLSDNWRVTLFRSAGQTAPNTQPPAEGAERWNPDIAIYPGPHDDVNCFECPNCGSQIKATIAAEDAGTVKGGKE